MSRAIEMVFYTGYACRWIHTFLKPLIRHGSSKHMWPGAQAFLKIKGVPHFNGDNEVDRKARSFLNRVGTTDDGHSIKNSVVKDEAAMEREEQKLKQELKDMDVEFKAMNALIDKCASAVSELEKFLTTKATRPLDASELTQVKDALARAGFNVDEVEKSKFSFRGDIKIVKPDGPEVLPKVKTDKSSHTYKAFPTIEVPLVSPDKEAQSSDALNPAKSGVSNVKKESELNQKTRMLDESKSRILMRYALLKALYVLEVGGSNCKAQVAFSNPRKLKCN